MNWQLNGKGSKCACEYSSAVCTFSVRLSLLSALMDSLHPITFPIKCLSGKILPFQQCLSPFVYTDNVTSISLLKYGYCIVVTN